MAKTATCPIPQNYKTSGALIQYSTGSCGTTATLSPSNVVLAYTAGANDSHVKALIAVSDDTSAKVLNVYRYDGTNYYLLGCVNIPIQAGTVVGTPPVDLLANLVGLPLDSTGKPIIPLNGGLTEKIYVGVQATLTSAKLIAVSAFGEDF